MLGSDRPIHESFAPQLIDQRKTMENQFAGMSDTPFTYTDFEETRTKLIMSVKEFLTDSDRKFLVSFESGKPIWSCSDYAEFEKYPSVQWKLLNLQKLKKNNPNKLQREVDKLNDILDV